MSSDTLSLHQRWWEIFSRAFIGLRNTTQIAGTLIMRRATAFPGWSVTKGSLRVRHMSAATPEKELV